MNVSFGETAFRRVRLVAKCSIAAACASLAVIACGDDDSAATPTQDAGAGVVDASGTQQQTDAGSETKDSSTSDSADARAPAPPILPQATTRIANAINPYGLVFASDGFLYASGATIDGTRKLAVWRFKDGVLDTTFGTAGVVTTTVGTGADVVSFDLVEVSAGNFVVHAVADGKVWLVKLTKDGQGAFSFGTPTFVKLGWDNGESWPAGTPTPPATPPSYQSWGIALDTSTATTPKIVVFAFGAPAKAADPATQRIDNDRWVTRVMADTLAIDTSFNGGKPFTADADGKNLSDTARRGRVFSDGSIVSAGYTNFGQGLGNHVVLIRLLANGTVDPAFGFGTTAPGAPGQTKVNPFVSTGGAAEAYDVARQSTGRYVTTGYGTTNFDVATKSPDLVSLRIKPDGLDTTFGKLGAFGWQSETDKGAGLGVAAFNDRGRSLAVLADDRIVHAGIYDDYASIFVFDKDGKPDTTCGSNGVIEYAYPAGFFKLAISPDGKHIAATAQSLNQTTDAGAPLGSVLALLKVGP
jgi:uncharacterized delta-60 repeat protein